MFEYVVLRRSEGGTPISAGTVAEARLFYQRVHLIVDRGTLNQLVRQVGISQLIALLQRPDFSAVYAEESLATMSTPVGPMQVYDFGAVMSAGSQEVGELRTASERLQFELLRSGLTATDAKRFARAFLSKVPVRKLTGDNFLKGGIPQGARSDLLDASYVRSAIRRILPSLPGGYEVGPGLKFEVLNTPLGNYVFDNIDFDGINRRRAALTPQLEPLTVAFLLGHIQDARADLAMAAHYGGDFVTSSIVSSIVQLRHDVLLQRTHANVESRRQFSEIVVPDMPTVGAVIDSGERTFDEFLCLLDKAARFKDWVKSANPDEGLAREYLRSVARQDWIQTTKSKGIRYMLTLAADAANPIAGLVAGFADNFLIEKLLGGWRPNHFIDDRLRPFLVGTQA